MDRLRDIHRFWNWLPAFRAVAETEHLPTAAQHLLISPPALSRTLGLLETALGRPLFRRVGRSLELNADGQRFLGQVRDGMRRIHEGLMQLQVGELAGHLRVSSAGLLTRTCVVPAMQALKNQHPALHPELHVIAQPEIASALLQGKIDLAFLSTPINHEHLEIVLLGHASNGIYCGRDHDLAQHASAASAPLSLEDLDEYEFLAPVPDADGNTYEGWPLERPRAVALRLNSMKLGAEVCAEGRYLAVLPDVVANEHSLFRLPLDVIPPIPLYGMRRQPLATMSAADLCLLEVEKILGTHHGIHAARA